MSDQTFGVKVSDEVRQKINKMVEASGMSTKEWFETLLNAYEVEALKKGEPDFRKDLSELELHTGRINQLVVNMIQRAASEKRGVETKLDETISHNNAKISALEFSIDELTGAAQNSEAEKNEALKRVEDAEKQSRQLEDTVESKRLIIEEYKNKIDTLSGLVTAYQNYEKENVQLKNELQSMKDFKKELDETRLFAEQKNNELDNTKTTLEETVNRLTRLTENYKEKEYEIKTLVSRHDSQLTQKEAEKERDLAIAERKYISEIGKLQEKISQLQEEKFLSGKE